MCCSPWGRKESDMTERLNWTEHHLKNLKFTLSVQQLLQAREFILGLHKLTFTTFVQCVVIGLKSEREIKNALTLHPFFVISVKEEEDLSEGENC